jgi:hypothetical protein
MRDVRKLNGVRAAKYAVKAASIFISFFILLIVAGPIVGAVTPQLGAQQQPLGIGVDLQTIQPQLQQIFSSGSAINGSHDIVVPAFNNWPLPGGATLFLTLVVHNQTVYQTQPAAVQLGPFQSGVLHISMDFSPILVAKLQGQGVGVGGAMSLSEGQFWTITVSFPQQ